jgi:hypothetical protein
MLGETAKIFFSNATMAESKKPTEEYCAGLLKDFDAMKRYDAAKTNINKKDFLLSDVGGCKDVMTALKGERVRIGARFASELRKGAASYLFAESW